MTGRPESSLDPRLEAAAFADEGVRPVVALPRSGPSGLMVAIAAVTAGLILFAVLDARRRSLSEPLMKTRAGDALDQFAPPPPLFIPMEEQAVPTLVNSSARRVFSYYPPPSVAVPAPRIVYIPQPIGAPLPMQSLPQRVAAEPALVIDTTAARSAAGVIAGGGNEVATVDVRESRSRAELLANRTTTVPQGTLIPAVLETAFDSTRPGFARAIVSRDVAGFDGRQVLIPRGSRLVGEYRSEVAPGQKRALVNWTRLIRPDGVTIGIGSPATDPLGRGGVRAKVNNHFFERFAAAILQSALDVGVNLASRPSSRTVIVALPSAAQGGASQLIQPVQVTPTLTVPPGTSISIFVARDLDFTSVENRR